MKNWPKVKTGKYVTFGYLPEDFYIISSPRKKNSTNVKIQFDFDFIDDENEQMKVVKQFLKFYQRSWTVNKLQTEVKYIVHSHKKISHALSIRLVNIIFAKSEFQMTPENVETRSW